MKTIYFWASLILISTLMSCGNNEAPNNDQNPKLENASNNAEPSAPKGMPVSISGQVLGLPKGSKVFFDKKTPASVEILNSVEIGDNGEFSLESSITQAGIYRLRLGANYVWLTLDGNEKLQVNAELSTAKINSLEIQGSDNSQELMQVLMKNLKPQELAKYLEQQTADQAMVNLFLVERLNIGAYIKQYKMVRNQLAEKYPNWNYTRDFSNKVALVEQQINSQPVTVGSPVPEIRLKDPAGKEIALSSLKGKVVLLDFWASWCGPCRRENPNVVSVYDKYNAQGFEVFSVSLDGLDDRRLAMFQQKPEVLKQQMDIQKKRWEDAIQQDRLKWPYHVSQLRGWSSPVAKQFGVNSIPKAFLIDRQGVIRYMNGLRGPGLEQKVKELL